MLQSVFIGVQYLPLVTTSIWPKNQDNDKNKRRIVYFIYTRITN